MRTLLLTGPGGAGTSTLAAAAAASAADDGERVLLVRPALPGDQPKPTKSPAGHEVVGVSPLAWADQQRAALGPLRALLGPRGERALGEGFLPVPGLAELAWWGVLREAFRGPWGLLVVDAGPAAEALRWIGLPDLLNASMRRWWPLEERSTDVAAHGGSWHARLATWIDSEAAELAAELRGCASVHLVSPARRDRLSVALRTLAPLALFEMPASSLTVLGPGAAPTAGALAAAVPGLRVQTGDPAGALPDLAPAKRRSTARVGRTGTDYRWRWNLPLARPADVAAVVVGDDLVLTVAGVRRSVPLPGVLRRCTPLDSEFHDGTLTMRFAPDPDLWPVPSGGRGPTQDGED
jgi:arsenite-transporting ATPase